MSGQIEKRKRDHLALCATDKVAFRTKTTLLEQVELVHRALPELSIDDLDLTTSLFGKRLTAPLWMSAITGGTPEAIPFNREMAGLAEELGIGFCLGSLKPMLRDPTRIEDFAVRKDAPSTLVMGNIGGVELASGGVEPIVDAVERLDADGLTVHLNPAMELTQPGGDTDFRGIVDSLAELRVRAPGLAVVVKETGCGLSTADGELLRVAGVNTVEVGGAGGTSWVGVETLRAEDQKARLGELLWDWGVPTAASVAWLAKMGFKVVAGGGIRNGLDAARALALGAGLVGVAAPLVKAYFSGDGVGAARELLTDLTAGLKAVMLLTGVRRPPELADVPAIIGPDLERWLAAWPSGS